MFRNIAKNKLLLIFFTLLIFISNINNVKSIEIGELVFDEILVNNKIYDFSFQDKFKENLKQNIIDNVIIGKDDKIEIRYHVFTQSKERIPILFRTTLISSKDTSVMSLNTNHIIYSNLKEDNYIFKVVAFSPQYVAYTDTLQINIRVSNELKKIADKLKSAQTNLNLQKKNLDSLNSFISNNKKFNNSENYQYLIYFLVILVVVLLGILIFLLISNKKLKFKNPLDGFNMSKMDKNSIEYLQLENENLKKELEALRGQIANMQVKSNELRDKNQELEENISKLSISKEELENLQQQKDDLFAIVIHDIKNPAAVIKSLVELLNSYDLNSNEQQDVIKDILATTKKIVSLSHEVSRVLALEGGKLRMEVEKVDVRDIVKDVTHRNSIKSKEKNIKVSIDIANDLNEVECDPQKVDEILDNLYSNALKFTPPNGAVKIKVVSIDDTVVFEVSDNGPGLSENDLKDAFKRGAKLSAKPTAGESSTGLGLWIVKKLVEAHHGRVWVRSSIGKGSVFSFSLPLTQTNEGKIIDMSKH